MVADLNLSGSVGDLNACWFYHGYCFHMCWYLHFWTGYIVCNGEWHILVDNSVFSGLFPQKVRAFLAHLSQRLKWAIVIVHRPSSVCPSVVRPSVNFHIFNFFSRTAQWILMKLGRDEVLMVPYKCCCFSARSAQGRIQGGAKLGHGGSSSSRIFFFRPKGYSDKPNA